MTAKSETAGWITPCRAESSNDAPAVCHWSVVASGLQRRHHYWISVIGHHLEVLQRLSHPFEGFAIELLAPFTLFGGGLSGSKVFQEIVELFCEIIRPLRLQGDLQALIKHQRVSQFDDLLLERGLGLGFDLARFLALFGNGLQNRLELIEGIVAKPRFFDALVVELEFAEQFREMNQKNRTSVGIFRLGHDLEQPGGAISAFWDDAKTARKALLPTAHRRCCESATMSFARPSQTVESARSATPASAQNRARETRHLFWGLEQRRFLLRTAPRITTEVH